MADFEYSVVTDAGLALVAAAIEAGHEIAFTKMKSGSGTYSAGEKTQAALRAMTALKSTEQTVGIATQARDGSQLTCGTSFNNTGLATGYYFREIGLFAKDNDDENAVEVLYAIAVTDNPSYMPAEDPDAPTVITMEYNTVVTNDVDYTVVISSHVYATASDLATGLAGKVDKVVGKGLSTNDFTNTLKDKLDGIAAGAEVNVQSDWDQSDNTKDDFIKNKPMHGTAAAKDATNSIIEGSTDLAESGAVYNALDDLADSIATALGNKVDKVAGKSLSTNDYDNTEKASVATFNELGLSVVNGFITQTIQIN